jgi:hypothetical protein
VQSDGRSQIQCDKNNPDLINSLALSTIIPGSTTPNPNANDNNSNNPSWMSVLDKAADPLNTGNTGDTLAALQTLKESGGFWGNTITQSEPYGIFTGAAAAAKYWAQADANGNGLAWIPGVSATMGDPDHLPGTVFTVGTVGLGSSVGATKAGQAILTSPLVQSLFAFDTGLNLGQAGTGKDLEGNKLSPTEQFQKGLSGVSGLFGLHNQPVPTNKTNSVADDLVPNSTTKPSLDSDPLTTDPNKVPKPAGDNFASPLTPVGRKGYPLNIMDGTNPPLNVGGRDYTGHALDQIQGRGLTPSVVENTIQSGQEIPGKIPGTTAYYDSVNNVTVITDTVSGRVITAAPGRIKQ